MTPIPMSKARTRTRPSNRIENYNNFAPAKRRDGPWRPRNFFLPVGLPRTRHARSVEFGGSSGTPRDGENAARSVAQVAPANMAGKDHLCLFNGRPQAREAPFASPVGRRPHVSRRRASASSRAAAAPRAKASRSVAQEGAGSRSDRRSPRKNRIPRSRCGPVPTEPS